MQDPHARIRYIVKKEAMMARVLTALTLLSYVTIVLILLGTTSGTIEIDLLVFLIVGGFLFLLISVALLYQRSYRVASLNLAEQVSDALQAKSQEVIDLKDEMLSIMSHQLKTPVAAIGWHNELLIDGTLGRLTKKQKETICEINDQTAHLKEIIDSLLNIARLESGRVNIEPVETTIRALIDQATKDVTRLTKEKNQEIEIRVSENTPPITVDPTIIHHVFMNLLSNATKYSPEKATIHIRAEREDEYIRIEIEDEGYGVPKEEQAHLFSKYFRATNATKKIKDGTGLGLYLCKMIVDLAGGDIGFESEEGKGTTFWFTLPLSGMEAHNGEVTLA